MKDVHPEFHYQVGATPNGVEQARNHCSKIEAMEGDNKPVTECPPGVMNNFRLVLIEKIFSVKRSLASCNRAPTSRRNVTYE